MIDLVMAVVGLKATNPAPEFRMIVLNIVKFIIDKLRSVYSFLHSVAPDVFADPQLVDRNWYTFPNITWGPIEVTSHDLVELYSFTPDILEVDSAAFEWWSINCGEARIQARTRAAGERSKVIRDWLFCVGCQYSGGAFGEDVANTMTKTVTVGTTGSLDVSISGLAQGEDADVLVIYPDGTTFQHLTASRNLPDMKSGLYEVQAYEITTTDGSEYIAKPDSQFVTVVCDSTTTANVKYVGKYGNLLLTVSGLPIGVDADIDVAGPNALQVHVVNDTLIDSLVEGTYTITSQPVTDPIYCSPLVRNCF